MSNILTDEQLNKDTKKLFNDFIEEIRSSSPSISEEEKNILILKLKELQAVYEHTNESKVADILEIKKNQVLKILGLGLENSNFNQLNELFDVLKNNPNATSGILVVEYLKSEKGFALFDDKQSEKDKEEMEEFFGGLFGLNLGKFLANHIKAEQIGSVLTYALSGKIEQDYTLFLKENPNAKEEEISEHIKECIQKSDIEFKVNFENNCNNNNGIVTLNNREDDKCRGKERIDNFVLDNDNNIFYTNVTSSNNLKTQKRTFINYFMAVQNFVKTRYINGIENPSFGKNVNCHYLCLGDFSYEKLTQVKSDPITRGKGKDTINYINNTDLSLEYKKDISQMPFLSLIQNCSNLDELTVMFAHNPIVIGVDTMDLFLHSEKINDCLNNNDIDGAKKLSLEMACKKFTNISNALSEVLDNNNDTEGNSIFTNLNIKNYIDILMNSVKKFSRFELHNNEMLYNNLFNSLNKLKLSISEKSLINSDFDTMIDDIDENLELLENSFNKKRVRASETKVNLINLFNNKEIPSKKENFNFIKKLPSQNPDVINGIKNKASISYEEKKELVSRFKSCVSVMLSSLSSPINSELLKISNIDGKNKKIVGTTLIKSFYEMLSSLEAIDYKNDIGFKIEYSSDRDAYNDYIAATNLIPKLKASGYGSSAEILKASKFLYRYISYKDYKCDFNSISINTNLKVKKLKELVNFIESKLDINNDNNYKNKM